MIIRQAVIGDASAISAITNQIIRETLVTFTTRERTPAEIEQDIAERGARFLVCEINGVVAGFATYAPFRAGPGYAHTQEHSIQLAKTARGKGMGQALMAQLEQIAIADAVHVLVAGISGANPKAEAFHRQLGFAKVGHMPSVGFKNGQWLDLILMQKHLIVRPDAAPDTSGRQG